MRSGRHDVMTKGGCVQGERRMVFACKGQTFEGGSSDEPGIQRKKESVEQQRELEQGR